MANCLCGNCLSFGCIYSTSNGRTKCNAPECDCDPKEFLVNNQYAPVFRSKLPAASADIPGSLISGLIGHTADVLNIPACSAGAVTLYNGGANCADGTVWCSPVDGSDGEILFHLYEIFMNHVSSRDAIFNLLKRLQFTGHRDNRESIGKMLKMVENRVKDEKDQTTEVYSTPEDLQNKVSPLSRLYLLITNYHTSTATQAATSLDDGYFNKETGKKYLDFSNLKHISSTLQLTMIERDFERTIFKCGRNGGRDVWDDFWNAMHTLLEGGDYDAVHLFIFSCLKLIDKDPRLTIESFMVRGFSLQLQKFNASSLFDAGRRGDPAFVRRPGGQQTGINGGDRLNHHNVSNTDFGAVTNPTGGVGACTVQTQNGFTAFCNKWNENKPCNRGVKTGPKQGQCAYCHKCRWCKTTDAHRAEEKNSAGNWVCPKHP